MTNPPPPSSSSTNHPQINTSSSIDSASATSKFSGTEHMFTIGDSFKNVSEDANRKDFYSDLIRGLLKVDRIERGHVTCSLTVKPPASNVYGSLHGGAVAAVAEMIAIACARTVVAEDKELFLGELSISYLSAALVNAQLEVDGHLVKSGRNVTVTSIEFRMKETKKLVYTARATFYITPLANL